MLGFAAMAKLTVLVTEKTIISFISNWKPLIGVLHEKER